MRGLNVGRSDWFYGGTGGKALIRGSPGRLCWKHVDVPGAHVLGGKGDAAAAKLHWDGDVGSAALGGSLVARGDTGWQGVTRGGRDRSLRVPWLHQEQPRRLGSNAAEGLWPCSVCSFLPIPMCPRVIPFFLCESGI